MSIFLSKFLPLFFYPLGLSVIILVVALLTTKNRNWRTAWIVIVLTILYLGGNRWISNTLVHSLEKKYAPIQENQKAEVIVVLAGGTESLEYPRQMVEVNGAGDRILYAASLYRQGHAPNILLCGGDIPWMDYSASSPAEDMAAIMAEIGIPGEALWLEGESQNTSENAVNCANIARERGIIRIILVTSAMHMPRSMMMFEDQGLEVIAAPTDFSITDASWEALWHGKLENILINLMPSAGNLSQTTNALKEYMGMLWYNLQ
jgi:uncharacterized SAM-binding protein YcdF (DUF218 family)